MDGLTTLLVAAAVVIGVKRINAERQHTRRRDITPHDTAARLRSAADAHSRGEIQTAWEEICDPDINWDYIAACLDARSLHAPEAPGYAAMIRANPAEFRNRLFSAAPAAASDALGLLVEATSSATALLAETEPQDRRPY